ncbi:MAG: hypothetical protein FWE18_01575 [Alphaproteobacteria bacterium]|nr:hypothetical protein [Alphaproteobacteria bacterium]
MNNTNQENNSNSNNSFDIEEQFIKLLLLSENITQQFAFLALKLEPLINKLDDSNRADFQSIIKNYYEKIEAKSKIVFQIDTAFSKTRKSKKIKEILFKTIQENLD